MISLAENYGSNFQAKVKELRAISLCCSISTYHCFLVPNTPKIREARLVALQFHIKWELCPSMSYAQGFSQLSFEAIRLLQHCKGLFLCSFIYGAQTFSDLEIWEKAISCPQRKRLRLLPLGLGGDVSLLCKQVTPLMRDYLPSQGTTRFGKHRRAFMKVFIGERARQWGQSSHQREPHHCGCWSPPAPKGAGGPSPLPGAQGVRSLMPGVQPCGPPS